MRVRRQHRVISPIWTQRGIGTASVLLRQTQYKKVIDYGAGIVLKKNTAKIVPGTSLRSLYAVGMEQSDTGRRG